MKRHLTCTFALLGLALLSTGEASGSAPAATPKTAPAPVAYADLPVGAYAKPYVAAVKTPKLGALPSHLALKLVDGMLTLHDKKYPEEAGKQTPATSCVSDQSGVPQATVRVSASGVGTPLHALQLQETPDGDATLISDSLVIRPGGDVASVDHAMQPLKRLYTLAGGTVVYAGRTQPTSPTGEEVHFVVRPAPSPDANAGRMPMSLMIPGRNFSAMQTCGFIHLALGTQPLHAGRALTAQLRMNVVLSVAELDATADKAAPRAVDLVTRPIAIALSLSQFPDEPAPRVSVAASWRGDETTARVMALGNKKVAVN